MNIKIQIMKQREKDGAIGANKSSGYFIINMDVSGTHGKP